MGEAFLAPPDQRLLWDQWYEDYTDARHSDHADIVLQSFVDALPQKKDLRVLEIGCGRGYESISLARLGFRVSAFDLSRVAIDAAERNAIEEGVSAEFRVHDATEPLPYISHVFNGAFAHLSLHYFDGITTRQIFAEISRVLTPGGVLLFTVRSVHDPRHGKGDFIEKDVFCQNGKVRRFFDEGYIKEILSNWDVRTAEVYNAKSQFSAIPSVFVQVLAVRS